ncbi:phage antirepressor [Limosilactobacillus fermentum]|uniref:phage antirepressor n=1 Tax=Limosilactobacillus fermentum TaxID=1613 RepID=UPI0027B8969F|nr:phage antirepressor [Limosilactobacillus fermentum]WLW45055.1 phage antirepressor [Limosilactobacillus fermentum]WLW45106.1 phage antirepressor [Limosilactobacillus fermentum]
MENQLQVFDFEGSNVRTVNIDGNPYFVGKDVATILGYKNTKDALLKHVDDEDKLGSQIATSGQKREMKVINESGLYSLILSSKLPSAKKFKRWVTSEVLPAIRKTGAYQAKPKDNYPIPATYGEALQLAATLQTKIEHDAPSLKYFHDQMRNPGLMTTTEIAKDYGWSARKLNKYLESKGVIYRQGNKWVIYQKYADKGYSQYEPFPYDNNKGVKNNLKWTQRGKKFIYDLLAEDGIRPILEQMNLLEG